MGEVNAQEMWWVAVTEGVQGPLSQGAVLDAIRAGRLSENTLVREGDEGQWVSAFTAFPAAFAAVGAEAGGEVASAPSTRTPTEAASATRSLNRRVNVVGAVLLSVVTVGIFWLVWVFMRLKWYAINADHPVGRRYTYFWLSIALMVSQAILSGNSYSALSLVAYLLAILVSIPWVRGITKDQQAIVRRSGTGSLSATPTVLITLWVVGHAFFLLIEFVSAYQLGSLLEQVVASQVKEVVSGPLTFVLFLTLMVGLPIVLLLPLVFFLIFFYRNHNVVVEAINSDAVRAKE